VAYRIYLDQRKSQLSGQNMLCPNGFHEYSGTMVGVSEFAHNWSVNTGGKRIDDETWPSMALGWDHL